jgi:hypothetical protein
MHKWLDVAYQKRDLGLPSLKTDFLLDSLRTDLRLMVTLNFYLYGDQPAATVAPETPLWEAWIQQRFPAPTETSESK